jgi:microcystin-dependent protein
MSFRRAQSRSVNRNAYLDNRLTTFTNPHIYYGDLHVERDETIGGNLSVGGNIRADSFYATGNYFLDTFVLIPAGTIIMSAAIAEPGGWLNCDGRLFNITIYPDLFSAIGYSFGGSDQSFNLPDMRGRAGIGLGQGSALTNRTLGAVGGAETHTLTTSEMPSHSHTGTTASVGDHIHGVSDPGHAHSQTTINDDFNNSGASPPGFSSDSAGSRTWNNINSATTGISINSAGAHTHTFTTDLSGGGTAHNNMQPFVVLRYLIKY